MEKPRTLSGFMELLPKDQALFDRMVDILKEQYTLYGFTSLDTPLIEASQVLLAKGGGETEKQIYRFTKGDADLSLRFDLTVPLAKYVAIHHNELPFPFRRFQIGKVYRGERAQRGRFREFYQADIDVIGDGKLDILNEAEIPSIIYHTFSKLGLTRFKIRVNNRKILGGIFEALGIKSQSENVMRIVDKLDKIGIVKVKSLLIEEEKLTEITANKLLDLLSAPNPLEALAPYQGTCELLDLGVLELTTLVENLDAFGVPKTHFEIDLTIARGLDYYTGTVYETTMLDYPQIGSICSGGRYDNLGSYYTEKILPGVGISIGLTRLFFILQDEGLLNKGVHTAPCQLLILPMTEDISPSISLATTLREGGISTQIYTEPKKFKAKMNYADKIGTPYVAFLGEDELSQGVVSVKDMTTGEQIKLPQSDLLPWLLDKKPSLYQGCPIVEKPPS